MAGTISSLGLGSGTLTSSLIDQLKSAETSSRVTPITTSITKTQSQKSDLSSLILSLSSVKTAALDLGSEATYLKRTATSTSTSIGISVTSGVSPQNVSMSVSQLAQNHVMQSKGFTSKSATVSLSNQTFSMSLGTTSYNVSVTAGMTLEQFAQKINDSTKGKITASILNTGDSTNPYRLILKAADSGKDNAITMSGTLADTLFVKPKIIGNADADAAVGSTADGDIIINGVSISGATLAGGSKVNGDAIAEKINAKTDETGVTATVDANGKITLQHKNDGEIVITTKNGAAAKSGLFATDKTDYTVDAKTLQVAQDAKFKYNGISMTRSSNSIDDVITGATFSLNSVTTSTVNLSIKQDTSTIPKLAEDFAAAFNSLNNKIKDLTKFDSATKTSGSLQGISEISSIYSKLSTLITKQNSDGVSLIDYGFSLDKTGSLSLDSTVLTKKLSENSSALEKLFRGTTEITKASYTANKTAGTTADSIPAGGIYINGVSIAAVTTVNGTAEENAQLFAEAINKSYEYTGVKAYTDGSGKLRLETPSGGAIKIKTTAAAAAASGLSASTSSDVAMQDITVGIGSTKTKKGAFADINSMLASMITGDKSTLQMLDKSFQSQIDSKTAEKEKTVAQIDTRYELMANQFALYDSMIAKFKNSFSSLQMQIDSMSS